MTTRYPTAAEPRRDVGNRRGELAAAGGILGTSTLPSV
jgi:hypothetical protein